MKYGVNIKINVSNIEKGRLFQGKKGKYLDAQVFIDIDNVSEYGDNGMVTQSITKEEKENGVKGQILGNATIFWKGDSQKPQQQQTPSQQSTGDFDNSFDDDIPFAPLGLSNKSLLYCI